jgi:sugar phosphate isomerase/epimerase
MMKRRVFIYQTSGLVLSAWLLPSFKPFYADKMDRIGMGTVLFRYRFKQTKPAELTEIKNELTLLDVPSYYRDRFKVKQLEFWSNHFESLDKSYLIDLKHKIKASGCHLLNVQVDSSYNLASTDERERLKSLDHVKRWMDAVSFLGSRCVRINPGSANGSVDKSIESMKLVNQYAKSKNLILLSENHFGIEMNPDLHLRIVKEAGPGNYTLPDFGNYPRATMYDSLEKILPHAYMISAKADAFNDTLEHTSYDFDRCVQMAEKAGFKGIYSVEQWNSKYMDVNFEKVADWLIDHVKANI